MDYRDELKELLVCQFGVVASMSEIDDGTELFLLGIDELDMLRLSMLIEERLGVCVPSFVLETDFRGFSGAGLSVCVKKKRFLPVAAKTFFLWFQAEPLVSIIIG